MNENVVIIPTYNEKENIEIAISKILNLKNKFDIIVVDDNSPDQTGKIVKNLIEKNKYETKIHLIERKNKDGLGSAYITGFKYALANNYDKIVQIDADLSHDPNDIPQLIHESKNYDLVIGSRYIFGIRIMNWPISRLLLSYFANIYSKII